MCGLFGFVGKPDMRLLTVIAGEAARRGPHAWGIASDVGTFKEVGSLHDQLGKLAVVLRGASWCIGNARMATFGAPDERNNQPIQVGRATVVHNGNIYGAKEIMHRLGHMAQTDTDTESLAAALHAGHGFFDLPYRGVRQAAIWKMDGDPGLYMASAGHPLYYADDPAGECFYVCSRQVLGLLPWQPVSEGYVMGLRMRPEVGVGYEVSMSGPHEL